jgi:hypothetical protein
LEVKQARHVFPPEPQPGRNGAEPSRARRFLGAAKRTLYGEYRSGTHETFDGRRRGNTFPLVSSERGFWTAGPMAA